MPTDESLLARYVEGLSNEEVARRMQLSVAAIESRLKRAKSKLRSRLARRGITWALAIAALELSQRQVRAVDWGQLVARTTEIAVSDGLPKSHSDVGSRVVEHLIHQEALAMAMFQCGKIALVGALIIGAVSTPLAWRYVVAADDGTAPVSPHSPIVELSTATAEDAVSPAPEVTVRLDTDSSGISTPNSDGRYDLKIRSAAERAIERALLETTALSFVETPLNDVVSYLENEHLIPIVIDIKAIEEIALSPDTPVTAHISGIKLRSAINHVLRDIGLTHIINNEMLLITTPEVAEQAVETRVYALDDDSTVDISQLAEMIPKVIAPDSWDEVGGEGTVVAHGEGLVILQTQEVHDQISDLLDQLHRLNRGR